MSSDQTTAGLKRVLAASFTWCFDETCQSSANTHLLVTRTYVPLEAGNAIAISYTWGEFDRRDVPIGHDESGNEVALNLGCEWSASEFIDKIASMGYDLTPTDTAMPFWIDQLCIPQDDEAIIRATLAAIPKIFYTFDAVALLPGSPCKCLRENLEAYGRHQRSDFSQAESDRLSIMWAEKMALCVNSTSFCSYFERVWTRQEMLYTRKMHLQWTGSETSRCVFPSAGDENIMLGLLGLNDDNTDLDHLEQKAMEAERDLAPFARQVYQRAVSTEITNTHALAKVKLKHDKAWHNTVLAFEDFLSKNIPRTYGRYYAIDTLCRFLLGEPLEFIHGGSRDAVISEEDRLRKFASRLSGVGWVQRSATRPRDYVLAVWIDCPRYVVPKEYATMSLLNLMEDAILQLERNFGMTVPVTAFAGLFGSPRQSAFWQPTHYLPDLEVQHTRHVYGPVVSDCPLLPIAKPAAVSLNVYNPRLGRSKNTMPFVDFVDGKTAVEILDFVRHIVGRWSNATMERIESARQFEFCEPVEGFRAGVKTVLLMSHPTMQGAMPPAIAGLPLAETLITQTILPMISQDFGHFYRIVFDLVCEALGLSLNVDRFRESLCLVVYAAEHPAIGICRQEQRHGELETREEEDPINRITICRDIVGPGSGHTLLEAVKRSSEGESLPTYVCVGIWVPQSITPWQHVSGTITDETVQNALII